MSLILHHCQYIKQYSFQGRKGERRIRMDLVGSERALIKALSWYRREAQRSSHKPLGKMAVLQPTFGPEIFRISVCRSLPSSIGTFKFKSSDFAHRFIHS